MSLCGIIHGSPAVTSKHFIFCSWEFFESAAQGFRQGNIKREAAHPKSVVDASGAQGRVFGRQYALIVGKPSLVSLPCDLIRLATSIDRSIDELLANGQGLKA